MIRDHSTVGFVVSTDGTVNGIGRELVAEPEAQIVEQLKTLGKPFVLVINSQSPYSEVSAALVEQLELEYDIPVEAVSI